MAKQMADDYLKALQAFVQDEFMSAHPGVELDGDTRLIDEGIIDSMKIFVLIEAVSEKLGVKLEADDVLLENFATLQTLAELVEKRAS